MSVCRFDFYFREVKHDVKLPLQWYFPALPHFSLAVPTKKWSALHLPPMRDSFSYFLISEGKTRWLKLHPFTDGGRTPNRDQFSSGPTNQTKVNFIKMTILLVFRLNNCVVWKWKSIKPYVRKIPKRSSPEPYKNSIIWHSSTPRTSSQKIPAN